MAWSDKLFSSGAKEKLAKVDVYNESRTETINKKADKINSNVELLDRVKNDPNYVKKTADDLQNKKVDKFVKNDAILSRVAKLLGGDYSILNAFLPENLAVLLKVYQEKDNLNLFRTNNSKRKYNTRQVESYTAANRLLDTIAPAPEYVAPPGPDDPPIVVPPVDPTINTTLDITSQTALFTQVISAFGDLHDSDSIANAIARITDPDVKREVYFSILDILINSVDLDNLDSAIDFISAEAILARKPSIVTDLLTNFTLPDDVYMNDYPAMRIKLLSLIGRINPQWYLTIRGNTVVRNLRPYLLMSEDALLIITPDSLHKAACMIVDAYREVNILDVARNYFPTAPI